MPAVIIRKDADVAQHSGVEGMHWYKRRFRNYDGTLTEEGKRRYYKNYYKKDRGGTHYGSMTDKGRKWADKEVKKAARSIDRDGKKKDNKKVWNRNIKQGKDKPNTSAVEYIARNSKSIVDETIKTGKTIATEAENARKRRNFKNNADGKSDQELRDRINRIRLEREYNSLTNDDTSRGYEVAMDVLNVAGSVASVALAAVGIAATIKSIKG